MIQGLYEAHLSVSDLKRSIQFYEGLELDHINGENLAFYGLKKIKVG